MNKKKLVQYEELVQFLVDEWRSFLLVTEREPGLRDAFKNIVEILDKKGVLKSEDDNEGNS